MAQKKVRKDDLIKLTWVDPERHEGWHEDQDVIEKSKIHVCYTYGKVLKLTQEFVLIAPTYTELSDVLNPICIPMVCVVSLTKLK